MSFCLAIQVSFEPVFFKSLLPMDCHRSTPATLSAAACKRLSWLCSRISTVRVSIACLEEHVCCTRALPKKSYLHRSKPRVISICGRSRGGFNATWNRLNGWVPIVEKMLCHTSEQILCTWWPCSFPTARCSHESHSFNKLCCLHAIEWRGQQINELPMSHLRQHSGTSFP